jgi:hypothetical protein
MRRLIALLAFLPACSQDWTKASPSGQEVTTIPVCVSVAHTQLPAVTGAIALWTKALGNWKRLQVAFPGDSCLITIEEVTSHEGTWLAKTNTLGGDTIWLKRGLYESRTLTIVSHELGHVFGAQHLDRSLMAPQETLVTHACPDGATVAQVAAYQRIPLTWLSYCY